MCYQQNGKMVTLETISDLHFLDGAILKCSLTFKTLITHVTLLFVTYVIIIFCPQS
jgi:hypothetical protein